MKNYKKKFVILLIAIHPEVRSCGYGTSFMDGIIDHLKTEKYLEIVLHSLKKSINFYRKYGFEEIKNKVHRFIFDYEGIDTKENIKLFKLVI